MQLAYWNTSLKKMFNLEPDLSGLETWSLRRLHADFQQKQEKNHVNENLEKTPKHIMLTESNANYWV